MNTDLTEGSSRRVLWAFSIPMLLSVVFQQLYNIVDSVIAGRFIGEDALAAVGASYPITMIYMAVAVGSSIGCAVVVSTLFGSRHYGRLKTAVCTIFFASAGCSLLISVSGLWQGDSMLRLILTPDNIFRDASLYLRIYTLGFVFLFLYNVCTKMHFRDIYRPRRFPHAVIFPYRLLTGEYRAGYFFRHCAEKRRCRRSMGNTSGTGRCVPACAPFPAAPSGTAENHRALPYFFPAYARACSCCGNPQHIAALLCFCRQSVHTVTGKQLRFCCHCRIFRGNQAEYIFRHMHDNAFQRTFFLHRAEFRRGKKGTRTGGFQGGGTARRACLRAVHTVIFLFQQFFRRTVPESRGKPCRASSQHDVPAYRCAVLHHRDGKGYVRWRTAGRQCDAVFYGYNIYGPASARSAGVPVRKRNAHGCGWDMAFLAVWLDAFHTALLRFLPP